MYLIGRWEPFSDSINLYLNFIYISAADEVEGGVGEFQ
jgi:hypothetical protein